MNSNSSQDKNGSGEKKRNNKGKQGKMNPKKPFAKVTNYETEESESDSSVVYVSPSTTQSQESSIKTTSSTLEATIFNILLSKLKGKDCLMGVDFCEVMSIDQGKGSKALKGNELKKHLAWKEQKMRISKLVLAGAKLQEMEVFLESSNVHLTSSAQYNEVSCNISACICSMLTNLCSMENVDNGILHDYFNRRFADIRNRRNYNNR